MELLGRTCLAFAALALVATACGDEPAARDHGDQGDVVAIEPPPSAPFSPVRISLATAHAASPLGGSKGGPAPAPTPAPPVDQCNLAPPPLPVDLLREPPGIASSPPTTLGLSGLTANARVQPHGSATRVWFEYGPTLAYGSRTPAKPLGPKLAAHYRESWDTGLGGWRGGSGADLVHHPGGFARYSEPTGTDYNHSTSTPTGRRSASRCSCHATARRGRRSSPPRCRRRPSRGRASRTCSPRTCARARSR